MSAHRTGRSPQGIDWTLIIAILATTLLIAAGALAINAKASGPDPGRVTVSDR